MSAKLTWQKEGNHQEAILGDFDGGDGVRFSISFRPTCYRRGKFCLLVEVATGHGHEKWGVLRRSRPAHEVLPFGAICSQ